MAPASTRAPVDRLSSADLAVLCREAGADDAGFVEIGRDALAPDRADLERVLPGVLTLVAVVRRMNPEGVRSPLRSASNLEFHETGHEVQAVEREIVRRLAGRGIRAAAIPMGFPMEMQRFGSDKTWIVSHKRVAVEAGLGHMGIHRNVIHPRFGNFVLLGSVLVAAELDRYGTPLEDNPCLTCKLCVAACPVGAVHPDGGFDWAACSTHNYREFLGGFADWVDSLTAAQGAADYRSRVTDAETVSMWQSLAYGPNYKAAYCLAVCPAGEEVIGAYRGDTAGFLERVVRPLQRQPENVYVVAGSDAEAHVARRFPHKTVRRVHSGLRPQSARGFLRALPGIFSRTAARDLDALYHFEFRGAEELRATVTIADQRVEVTDGWVGAADTVVRADAATWVAVLRGEASLAWALLRGRVRVRGSLRKLAAFRRAFPS
jgi:ferredoxin